jgi:hypothetical protein
VFRAYAKARENHEFLKKFDRGEKEKMATSEEVFGAKAGKVWLALKGSKPLNSKELSKKTCLKECDVYGALGWLGREGKINVVGNAESGYAYALK